MFSASTNAQQRRPHLQSVSDAFCGAVKRVSNAAMFVGVVVVGCLQVLYNSITSHSRITVCNNLFSRHYWTVCTLSHFSLLRRGGQSISLCDIMYWIEWKRWECFGCKFFQKCFFRLVVDHLCCRSFPRNFLLSNFRGPKIAACDGVHCKVSHLSVQPLTMNESVLNAYIYIVFQNEMQTTNSYDSIFEFLISGSITGKSSF